MREYDRIAAWFAATRSPDVGVPDLDAFARTLPRRARVLDLGCGAGVPVSRLLRDRGARLAALDSSPAMVARYRARFPDVPTRCVRLQEARVAPGSFDAVVAWGVLFHLNAADQVAAIQDVAAWLAPRGRFLFTSGGTRGVTEGDMGGVAFRYVSLGAEAYRTALEASGMRLDDHHVDAWGNDVYVATKATEAAGPAS